MKDLNYYMQSVATVYEQMNMQYRNQVNFRVQPGNNIEFTAESGVKYFFPISYPTLFRVAETFKPKRYFEIGSQGGFSASVIACASQETELFLFDCPGCGYGGFSESTKYLEEHMGRFALNRHHIAYGPSQNMFEIMKTNAPYDMLYIDGDHSYGGAKSDWDMVKQLAAMNAKILIDDITHIAHAEELNRLFDEMVIETGCRFEKLKEETGIGVIYLGEPNA
jgi:predicted O-methyltransferase YrrM